MKSVAISIACLWIISFDSDFSASSLQGEEIQSQITWNKRFMSDEDQNFNAMTFSVDREMMRWDDTIVSGWSDLLTWNEFIVRQMVRYYSARWLFHSSSLLTSSGEMFSSVTQVGMLQNLFWLSKIHLDQNNLIWHLIVETRTLRIRDGNWFKIPSQEWKRKVVHIRWIPFDQVVQCIHRASWETFEPISRSSTTWFLAIFHQNCSCIFWMARTCESSHSRNHLNWHHLGPQTYWWHSLQWSLLCRRFHNRFCSRRHHQNHHCHFSLNFFRWCEPLRAMINSGISWQGTGRCWN
jgi:hypothetical protein